MQAVAVVQRAMRQADPAEVMAELGFGEVDLVSSFAVSMSGTQALPVSPQHNNEDDTCNAFQHRLGVFYDMTAFAFHIELTKVSALKSKQA